jgi:hypothetical protein
VKSISREDHSDWLRNPITQAVKAGFESDLQGLFLLKVLGAARMSTDPKVTAAMKAYDTVREMVESVFSQEKDDEQSTTTE